MNKKLKQFLALAGVALIMILFIATLVFLLIGNAPVAILLIGVNGFFTVVLYFTLRFKGKDSEYFNDAVNKALQGDEDPNK